jgi:Leucine-rich repeat (LRR) protein
MIKSQCLFASSLKKLDLENSGNLGGNIECSSLTILHLSHNPLESIELQMWNLPLLQELKISYCSSLTIIKDSEPIYPDLSLGGARCRMVRFPKLTHLTIWSCDKLETIDDLIYLPAIESIEITSCGLLSLPADRFRSFPRLKDLEIVWCENLYWHCRMLLPSSLQKLWLRSCGDFSAWFPSCLENLTSLQSLKFSRCEGIVSIPGDLWSSNLKSLKSLEFHHCSKLKSIGGLDAIAYIRDLYIDHCPDLKEIDQPLRKGSSF